MPYEILYRESFGEDGPNIVYIKPPETFTVVRLNSSLTQVRDASIFSIKRITGLFKEIFLPIGYPNSVSQDYAAYQIWDTIQASCSTIGNALTTQAILKGVGVGDTAATSLSASITWILKDGFGMISRIAFAWFSGSGLDCESKKWRLLADIVNDFAMLVELAMLPLVPSAYTLHVLAISSSLRAIVGVAGGATRAAVTHHQAINDNMGDVSAKDGSQETCVNLIASILAVFILSNITGPSMAWCVFAVVTVLHLYANYRCVRCLVFNTFNAERHHIVVQHYLKTSQILTPEEVSERESVFLGFGLSDWKLTGCRLQMGASLAGVSLTPNRVKLLADVFKERKYFTMHAAPTDVRICLSPSHPPICAISAYFYGSVVAVAASLAYKNSGVIQSLTDGPDDPNHLINRLLNLISRWSSVRPNLNFDQVMEINQLLAEETPKFIQLVEKAGWTTSRHQLHSIDLGWRSTWRLSPEGRSFQA